MTYKNIAGAQRTRLQALKHILASLKAGKLGAVNDPEWGSCAYEVVTNGVVRNCGVGCLFSPAQIRSLKVRHMNSDDIRSVSKIIGVDNIEAVTGLELDELETLQMHHDDEHTKIREGDVTKTNLYKYLVNSINDK